MLSPRETALLSTWERERRSHITQDELRALLGPRVAIRVIQGMTRKGILERVGPGIYTIHPLRSLNRPRATSAVVATAALLADEPYYLGGWWTFSLHHLTQQVFAHLLDAYVTRKRNPRTFGSAHVTFHVLPPTAFEYGIITPLIEGTSIAVSNPERTI